MLGAEGHHGEILRLVHELLGVALLGHIDRQRRAAPKGADAAPADGHGVVFLLAACSQNLGLAEPLEAVLAETLLHLEFLKAVLLLRLHAGAKRQRCHCEHRRHQVIFHHF